MPKRFFSRHYRHISFSLVIKNAKRQKALDKLCDALDKLYHITVNKAQKRALALIVLNFIYSNYNPLIISLSNNSYKKIDRYNRAGVGSKAFKEVFRKLRRNELIWLEFEAMPGANRFESTVISPSDALRVLLIPSHQSLLKHLRDEKELILLRKTVKKGQWDGFEGIYRTDKKRVLCKYSDSSYTHNARRFLKRYNKFLRSANLSWAVFPRQHFEEHFEEEGLTRDQIRQNFDTFLNERDLYRVFAAPTDYNPNIPRSLPKLGGRFYGGFWIDSIPSIARPSLLINGEPVVEIDVRAMNVTMLYLMSTGESWHIYPYSNVRLPNSQHEFFPKEVIKPFFTWCLNNPSRKSAIQTLTKKLPDELLGTQFEHFLSETGIRPVDIVNAALASHPLISHHFFQETPIGMKLQFHDSEIAERVLKQCLDQGIFSFPIHDAFLVPVGREIQMKTIIVSTICSYFGADLQNEYLQNENNRCITKSTYAN